MILNSKGYSVKSCYFCFTMHNFCLSFFLSIFSFASTSVQVTDNKTPPLLETHVHLRGL